MKNKYDKSVTVFYGFILLLTVISFSWAVAKAYSINWDIFKINSITLNIYVGLLVGLYFTYFLLKELMYFRKHKKIIHGYDERNAEVVSNSLRNAGSIIILILIGASYYFSLFHDTSALLFSVRSISYVLVIGIITFFISFWYYYKKRNL